MEKYILATIVALAAIIGFLVNISQPTKAQTNALTLANVEALSYNEYGYDRGCLPSGLGCTTGWNVWLPNDRGDEE